MNREILFRGKRIDNGEWVEGFYTQLPKASLGATIMADGDLCAEDVGVYIIVVYSKQHPNFYDPLEIVEHEIYEVIFETVGEYTGLTDENGKKIFEGDIIRRFSNYSGKNRYKPVTFEIGCFWLKYDDNSGALLGDIYDKVEVIGNIHDNPELLEVNL